MITLPLIIGKTCGSYFMDFIWKYVTLSFVNEGFIPKSGGYQNLLAFKIALMMRHFTLRFCDKFISKKSRTHDQMVQAARSGSSNIEEGSIDSACSKHSEFLLTGYAKGSLQELKGDYIAYLEDHHYEQWPNGCKLAVELVKERFIHADDMIRWIGRHKDEAPIDCLAANAAIIQLNIALSLTSKLLKAQEKDFLENGGIKERMRQARLKKRRNNQDG